MASALRKQLNVALSSTPAELGCQCTWQRNCKEQLATECQSRTKRQKLKNLEKLSRSVKLISVELEGFGRTLDMLNA